VFDCDFEEALLILVSSN